jgi:hypothetical protein
LIAMENPPSQQNVSAAECTELRHTAADFSLRQGLSLDFQRIFACSGKSRSASMGWKNAALATAKPFTPVQFRAWPPMTFPLGLQRYAGAAPRFVSGTRST